MLNSADDDITSIFPTNVVVFSTGDCLWVPRALDLRPSTSDRSRSVGASGHLPEHVPHRHHVVSVRRAEVRHEVRLVDVRHQRHRSPAERRRLRPVQLHDQRRVGTPRSASDVALFSPPRDAMTIIIIVVIDIFSARCNIYISRLSYDVSVRLSVRLSVYL